MAAVITNAPAYPADAKPIIQAGLNTADVNRGGDVRLTQGRYKLNTGLKSTVQGLNFLGEGLPGISDFLCRGSTQLVCANGITGLELGTSGTHGTRGYGVRHLHFLGEGGGIGIAIYDAEGDIIEDLSVSDFTSGVGMLIHGGVFSPTFSGNSQYATLRNFRAGNCAVGLKLDGPTTGVRLDGGYFEGAMPPQGTVRRGTGLLAAAGDTVRSFGTVWQGWDVCVNLRKNEGHELTSPRFENFNTGIRVGAETKGFYLNGGCFNNGLVGVHVEAGAQHVVLDPAWIAPDVQTPFLIEPGADVEVRYS